MAGEWLLKVGLQLDKSQAQKMENDLNGRFGRVANKFSSRIGDGLKRLAYSGLLASAVGALLQPLDKLNDRIDSTLDKFSDIRSQAMGFGVDEAQYLKARILSEAVGVTNFDTIFASFKKELIKANKGIPSSLEQFRGRTGSVEDFMQVISSLKQARPDTRQLMTAQIFGQEQVKEVNKLIWADLTRLSNQLNQTASNEDINVALQRNFNLRRDQAILQGKRTIDELIKAPEVITQDTLNRQDEYYRTQNQQLNEQMRQYKNVATIQKGVDKVVDNTNKIASGIGAFVNYLRDFTAYDKRLSADLSAGKITREEYEQRINEFTNKRGVFD